MQSPAGKILGAQRTGGILGGGGEDAATALELGSRGDDDRELSDDVGDDGDRGLGSDRSGGGRMEESKEGEE